nr:autotransporter outer membrane beta-barrel domain-containing protein [uncultured Pseudodesulfovibrio sp.]
MLPIHYQSRIFFSRCTRFVLFSALFALLLCPHAWADDLTGAPGSGIQISGDGSNLVYTDDSNELFMVPVSGGSATYIASGVYNIYNMSDAGEVVYDISGQMYLYSRNDGASYLLNGSSGILLDSSNWSLTINSDGTALAGSTNSNNAVLWIAPSDWSTASSLAPVLLSSNSSANSVSSLNSGEWKVAGRTNSGSNALVWTVNSAGSLTSTVNLEESSGSGEYLISGNGSTVAGVGDVFNVFNVWNAHSGQKMVAMAVPDKYNSLNLLDINNSGSVVVGSTILQGSGYSEAAYWTGSNASYTYHNLREVLEEKGVSLASSSTLYDVTSVSADGSIMVGTGMLPGGFKTYIANVSLGGIITPEQLNQSLGTMGQVGPAVAGMGQLSMSRLGSAAGGQGVQFAVSAPGSASGGGSGAERGMSSGDEMPGRLDLWMVGSVGTNIELNGDDLGLHGGVGLTWERGEWRVGGGVFGDSRDLDTSYGGNQDIKAVGPGAFVAYSPEGTNLEFRVSGLWQTVSLDLKRGYANGAGSATSTGSTDADVFGLSGRVQWTRGMSDVLALTPFAEYTWQNTHIDGYSESGGPFPASFDSRNETSNSLRAGLRADMALFEQFGTWAWAAWDHRFEDKSSGLGGSALGLGSFSYSGARVDQDWADVGVGTSWDVTERLSANSSLGFALGCDDDTMSDVTATVGFSYQLW